MVAPPGLEPEMSVPKTDVLPLHHGAKSMGKDNKVKVIFVVNCNHI